MQYKCKKCGNTIQEELNIEGYIHHNRPVLCFNTKLCNKKASKNNYD